jgi:uncharacterized YigZ family protein
VDVSATYRTVARTGEAEIEVKRSRFRGHVERVDSERAAHGVLERARKQHWDARHHCSAFVLGPDAAVVRSSDDGEPSGTAGAPMLEVIRGRDLSDVVAVVTRWFGGTLLGAGGLVRAYGDAVRAALDAAGVLERRLWQRYDVPADHADAGRLEGELRARGIRVLGVDYAERALLHVAASTDDFAGVLAELTSGAVTADHVGAVWLDQ